MKALLISPTNRPDLAALTEAMPLPNLPVLGQSLVEHWLEHLARRGAKQVRVLAADRPDQVRRLVGGGARWGLHVDVIPEKTELTPAQARAKYRGDAASGWLSEPDDAVLMDHLPGRSDRNLCASYADWFAGLQEFMPLAAAPHRLGLTERAPGIWVGRHTRVAPSVELRAPCWLGKHVRVGPECVIGPGAILEDRVLVEGRSRITNSVVGPDTFVGTLTALQNSLAWGSALVNWRAGTCLSVPDPFVMSSLAKRSPAAKQAGLAGRFAAWAALALTLPWGLAAIMKSKISGRPALRPVVGVRPRGQAGPRGETVLTYYELENAPGWLRRWPQLWNVARGEFTWVGNRPLRPDQAEQLANDFERLWLAAPVGLFSLADTMGCTDAFGDEARAHASFYAVQANRRLDWSILRRGWQAWSRNAGGARDRTESATLVSPSLAEAEE